MSDLQSETMAAAFKDKFGVEIETTFNIFSMRHVTARIDDADFTAAQVAWIDGWEKCALAAYEAERGQ